MPNIAVLGAGVVGLSTAININKLLPEARITIIADRFNAETTSYGAAGMFLPRSENIPGVPKDLSRQWVSDSWDWFSNLTLTDMASEAGTQLVSGYYFCNKEMAEPLYSEFVFSYCKMTDEELRKMKMDKKYKYGHRVTTIVTCCKQYLPWLTKYFLATGGIIDSRHINSLNEVGFYDVVVNCTGLGSKTLLDDNQMYATRGQVARIRADLMKCWMYTDDETYIIPNGDVITIGGIRQKDNYNLNVEQQDSKAILERCVNLWPPLKGCKLIEEWVGLRPSRTSLRLGSEHVKLEKGTLKVVHNYGHGSSGVSLSWGTSKQAAKLVVDMLSNDISRL